MSDLPLSSTKVWPLLTSVKYSFHKGCAKDAISLFNILMQVFIHVLFICGPKNDANVVMK